MSSVAGVPRSGRTQQNGVGLIEVLVALLILTIGFLATANMQMVSMRANQNSQHRGQAGLLVTDMIDRMRSNPSGIADGFYDGANTDDAATAGKCVTIQCTPEQQAVEDIALWRQSLVPATGGIPALPYSESGDPANGTIINQGDGVYAFTLTWQSTHDGAVADESLTMLARP